MLVWFICSSVFSFACSSSAKELVETSSVDSAVEPVIGCGLTAVVPKKKTFVCCTKDEYIILHEKYCVVGIHRL
jgi:hypothetical protein